MGHCICHVRPCRRTFYAVFALSKLRNQICFSRGDKYVEFKIFMFVLSDILMRKKKKFPMLFYPTVLLASLGLEQNDPIQYLQVLVR